MMEWHKQVKNMASGITLTYQNKEITEIDRNNTRNLVKLTMKIIFIYIRSYLIYHFVDVLVPKQSVRIIDFYYWIILNITDKTCF